MDIKFIRDDVYEKSIKDLNEIISKLSKEIASKDIIVGERFINAMIVARKTMIKEKEEKKEEFEKVIEEKPNLIKPHIPNVEKLKKIIPEVKFEDDLSKFKTQYPIIIFRGLNGDIIAKSYLEDREGKFFYRVEEKEVDTKILDEIKKVFFEKFLKERKVIEDDDLIKKITKKVCNKYKKEFNQEIFDSVKYYLRRDFLGFGKIEPLIEDEKISKIICRGTKKPVIVNYGEDNEIETNIVFDNENELSILLTSISEKIGEIISEKNPHIDGTFMNFRIEANLGVGGSSSNFVITRIP
jgi:flagellar protein FlaI